jgi:hypothetical protein
MIFAKPVLTEDLYIVQKEDIFNNMLYVRYVHLTKRPSIFIRHKPILSSERMLHKDYYRRSSVEKKNSGRESQRAWLQDALFGSKPPAVEGL